ncbi:MAG: DUF4080 domain-containing protein [Oscillospiraceae bacterium]
METQPRKPINTFKALLCVLNAKYVHCSPAPYCLAAGVFAYAPHINAEVCEATINEKESDIKERILAKCPSVVTFSCYIWNITATLSLAAKIKKERSDIIIVLGGPEVSYSAEDVLKNNPFIDYILSGEGEESLPALLDAIANNKPLIGIDGLCRINGDTAEIQAPCVLKGTPVNPYTKEYLSALSGRIAYLETSRGCPYSCAFCLSGRCGKPRYFDMDEVYRRILTLANSGAETIKLVDRTFNANPRHANAILRFILQNYGNAIPYGVCFHFEIAGDILTSETMSLFESAPRGAFQLEIGIQSLSEETLVAVRRKTDMAKLWQNLHRVISSGNMHVHIDLIAGLPYEGLESFANGFNTAYALGANMLQLGFLKLLYGSAMREESAEFPCEYSKTPPYEVLSTPWLSAKDIEILKGVEDALERLYNSGRFRLTLIYVLKATCLTPFELFAKIGAAPAKTGLDDYIAHVKDVFSALDNVDEQALRDAMVEDYLSTNSAGRLPCALRIYDDRLKTAVKLLASNVNTAPKSGIKRSVALLYGEKSIAFVDYTQKDAVTGRYVLLKMRIDFL